MEEAAPKAESGAALLQAGPDHEQMDWGQPSSHRWGLLSCDPRLTLAMEQVR